MADGKVGASIASTQFGMFEHVEYECIEARNPYTIDSAGIVRMSLMGRGGIERAVTIIDYKDLAAVAPHRWCLHSNGYAFTAYKNGRSWGTRMHRLIMRDAVAGGLWVDHINRNRLDNRRSNLRAIPPHRSGQNVGSRRGSSSKYRGVTYVSDNGSKPWKAQAGHRGRVHLIGTFATEIEAARAAQAFRRKHMLYSVD